ncbi:hypothetical protein P3T76_001231 [Phytophthora citrophthora]|uniref:Uncharacterized protein n=1 Tax=Phytophthora citrophthora TaxID=4793 RepID=A0AAD9H0D0_9STRA|nr:hypothetical protein P3T76_001231 [Phytophthora citrophthora]
METAQVVTAEGDGAANRIEQSTKEMLKEMNRIRVRRFRFKKHAKLASAVVTDAGGKVEQVLVKVTKLYLKLQRTSK